MAFTLKFNDTETKCSSCANGQKMKTKNETFVYCHTLRKFVPPIYECSSHTYENEMDLWEMKEKGWVLEVKKGRVIGFVSPDDKKKGTFNE